MKGFTLATRCLTLTATLVCLPCLAQDAVQRVQISPDLMRVAAEEEATETATTEPRRLQVSPDVLRAATEQTADTVASRTATLSTTTLRNLGITEDKLRDDKISVFTAGRIEQVTRSNAESLMTTDALIIEKTGTTAIRTLDATGLDRFTLPVTMKEIEQSASGELVETSFSPDIFPRTALEYHGDAGTYKSIVSLGVFEDSPAGSKSLKQPLGISLASRSLSVITPADLRFETLNDYLDVEVSLSAFVPEPTLIIRPNFQSESFEIPLPMGSPPELLIDVETPGILGLGLEATHVSLQTRNIVNPEGTRVRLQVTQGKLANNGEAELDADGRASLALRSTGLGEVRITSNDQMFATVTEGSTSYEFRWTFIAAVLLGGLAGSAVTRRKTQSWGAALFSGVLTGIVVVAAYAIGINLLGITPVAVNGEALAFVLAALGAVAGPTILNLKKPAGGDAGS